MRKLGSGMHAPDEHDSPIAQTRPHTPQLALSRLTSVHAPIAPQRTSPALHGTRHAPLTHSRSALHGLPQRPQCELDERTSVHTPLHVWLGGEQPPSIIASGRQAPETQLSPAPQIVPHAPQFKLSLLVSAQVEPHTIEPMVQLVVHAPPLQS